MRCYVINLKDSVERLATFNLAALKFGWNVSRVEGIAKERLKINTSNNGNVIVTHMDYSTITLIGDNPSQRPGRNRKGKHLHEGNYACILSHLEIWKKFLESSEDRICVFEDDAVIQRECDLSDVPEDADFVFLGDRVLAAVPDLVEADQSWLENNRYAPLYPGCGTEAYMVTRSGAAKGIALMNPVTMPIDLQLFSCAHGAAEYGHWLAELRSDSSPICNIYTTTVPYAVHLDSGKSDSIPLKCEVTTKAKMHQSYCQDTCGELNSTILSPATLHVCLSLPKRTDRRFVFQKSLPDLLLPHMKFWDGLDSAIVPSEKLKRFEARYGLDGVTAANYSVRFSKRRILSEFCRSKFRTLAFYEDDCAFSTQFLDDAHLLLSEMPSGWDIAFLGGQLPFNSHAQRMVVETPPSADNHCMLLSRSGARKILRALRAPVSAFSDQNIKQLIFERKLNAYWAGRYTAWQRDSSSDNSSERCSDPFHFRQHNMFAGVDDVHLLAAATAPGSHVLEWGSGGSTSMLASLVGDSGKVLSIEHNPYYLDKTEARLRDLGFSHRVDLVLALPSTYRSGVSQWRMLPGQMDNYVNAPRNRIAKESMDVVFVDGRERIRCIQESLPLLKPGGYLLVHDFWSRERYRSQIAKILCETTLICSTPMGESNGKVSDMAMFQKK